MTNTNKTRRISKKLNQATCQHTWIVCSDFKVCTCCEKVVEGA